jgi:hypothetical protein
VSLWAGVNLGFGVKLCAQMFVVNNKMLLDVKINGNRRKRKRKQTIYMREQYRHALQNAKT